MSNFALDAELKTVAEVAKDLNLTERRIQQMIEAGNLAARKATDLEELALRQAGRIGRPTEKGAWLIRQDAVHHLQQRRTVALERTNPTKVGYPKHRPRSRQNKLTTASQAFESALKEEPFWKVPTSLTPLIGREQDVATICALLTSSEVRLLTLLGAGGIGKTRLSLQVALQMREHFVDGVCFVPLASLSDAALFVPTMAQELNIQETGVQPIFERVKFSLREKRFLLLLDNFEQIMTAAPLVEDLLVACPLLTIVVTSRAVLHVQGEHEFSVPRLALPDLTHLPEREILAQIAAVALFIQRARTILHTFELTNDNASAIGEICVRLDGLPLAIELAAARIKLLSSQELLIRLTQPLAVLTGGTWTGPARQQTLRNTLKWSYDLLNSEEQCLFRRLSVFVNGWILEAVEAVMKVGKQAGNASFAALDSVAALLDKSFLYRIGQDGKELRLIMLQTVREYGLECLMESGEMETIRQAHASYYLGLAEAAEREYVGPQQVGWIELLEQEHDNLRAAMQWLMERKESEHSREMALRLGGALGWFWMIGSYTREGLDFLEKALAGSEDSAVPIRANALETAANLSLNQGNIDQAEILVRESLGLYREIGDKHGIANSLSTLVLVAIVRSNFQMVRSLTEEALALYREMGNKERIAYSLCDLAYTASQMGDYATAHTLFEESVAVQRELDNKVGIAVSLFQLAQMLFLSQGDSATIHSLLEESLALAKELGQRNSIANYLFLSGLVAFSQGDITTANSLFEEELMLLRKIGDQQNTAETLNNLAKVKMRQNDYATALALCEEGLALAMKVGDKVLVASGLEELAGLVAAQGEPTLAARLWGTAESLREAIGTPIPPVWRSDYTSSVAFARGRIGERDFAAALAQGRIMTPEQAIAVHKQATMSLHILSKRPHTPLAKAQSAYPDDLTAREVDVLRLVAQGWTDARISESLVISPRTVNTHLTSIYRKIQVSSRSAATRYALEHKLV